MKELKTTLMQEFDLRQGIIEETLSEEKTVMWTMYDTGKKYNTTPQKRFIRVEASAEGPYAALCILRNKLKTLDRAE